MHRHGELNIELTAMQECRPQPHLKERVEQHVTGQPRGEDAPRCGAGRDSRGPPAESGFRSARARILRTQASTQERSTDTR